MTILLIDNYDSFTYNLVHYLKIAGADVIVKRNDEISIADCLSGAYDKILISPGPGKPSDAGICLDLIKENKSIPLLGVCLGHQSIGQVFGAEIIKHTPMHGKTSEIEHYSNSPIFNEIPKKYNITRYHSLIIDEKTIPSELTITAKSTDDNIIMAIQHKSLPIYGVQFHPESIASEQGHKLIENFLKVTV